MKDKTKIVENVRNHYLIASFYRAFDKGKPKMNPLGYDFKRPQPDFSKFWKAIVSGF